MKKTIKKIILIGTAFLISAIALAEPLGKHPRVAELEDSLREASSVYLKARFPDRAFLVNISVEPLRRSTARNPNDTYNETLPFYDGGSNEEIQDEWDDPKVTLHSLMLRTSKINVAITLNDTLNDAETAEIKESIFKNLHLIPARDEIQINFRSWATSDKRWFYPVVAFILAGIFLAGFFMIQRVGVGKITHALKESAKTSGSGSGPSPMAVQTPTTGASEDKSGGRGGLNISDPFKAREVVVGFIGELVRRPTFPTLRMMIALDQYGARNPLGLGAILGEFLPEHKNKLFERSPGLGWFEPMNHPGLITMDELELVQNLVREGNSDRSPDVEDTLIRVWRIGDRIPEFMRGFPKDTVLSILSHLPKNHAIKAARNAIPGAWADLLDPDFKPKPLDLKTLQEISKKADDFLPLHNLLEIRRHQSEGELRDFLLVANPDEEREIYLASRPDSSIHQKRPPFYILLEKDEAFLKDFVPRFRPVQWALALFNVSKTDRTKIQTHLSEKQNFLFIDHLKRLDASNPDMKTVGQTRESIALAIVDFIGQKDAEAKHLKELEEWTKNNATEEKKPDEKKAA